MNWKFVLLVRRHWELQAQFAKCCLVQWYLDATPFWNQLNIEIAREQKERNLSLVGLSQSTIGRIHLASIVSQTYRPTFNRATLRWLYAIVLNFHNAFINFKSKSFEQQKWAYKNRKQLRHQMAISEFIIYASLIGEVKFFNKIIYLLMSINWDWNFRNRNVCKLNKHRMEFLNCKSLLITHLILCALFTGFNVANID